MATPSSLIGPPEIYRQTPISSAGQSSVTSGNPFMDVMVANFNSTTIYRNPPMGLTENLSPTFLSTGNPCLDFFFHVVPDTPPSVLTQRLKLAWDYNPLTTLKLVCNLRGVRGMGNSDKEGYYTAAIWLHKHHPKTLACNVGPLADFGYFKDLPEILYRLLDGPDGRRRAKEEWNKRKLARGINRRGAMRFRPRRRFGGLKPKKGKKTSSSSRSRVPREARVLAEIKRAEIVKEKARKLREDKKIAAAKKALERYRRDPDFRFLYDRVSELLSEVGYS